MVFALDALKLPLESVPERWTAHPAVPRVLTRRLKVALFSGNFNYTADGANLSLNRLAAWLQRQGVEVRAYSPTTQTPAFAPAAPLVSVPSIPFPGRAEYHVGIGITPAVRRDLDAFAPDLVHVSAPDLLGHAAQRYARRRGVPVVGSFHTRFDTYFDYYGLGWLSPWVRRKQYGFFARCDRILAPAEPIAQLIRQETGKDVRLWTRGVDRQRFTPTRRSAAWRIRHGLGRDELLVGFVGRLVKEKGLELLAEVIGGLEQAGVPHRLVVVGDGPERRWLEAALPGSLILGFLEGDALADAYANLDLFFNPSRTETFGNVTLEAMASGVPVVAVRATGAESIVDHAVTGVLVDGAGAQASIDAISALASSADRRAAMRNAARARSQLYSWDEILAAVLDTYLELVPARL